MKLLKYFTLAIAAIALVACSDDTVESNSNGNGNNNGDSAYSIVLTASNYSVEVNTPITFTVTTIDGQDVTAESSIFEKTNDFARTENPFTPTKDGEYIFFASYDGKNSAYVAINVVPSIPELPEDPMESSTSFHHRILLVDHTGVTCSNCPDMMLALKDVEETTVEAGVDLRDRYYEAAAHTYNNDPLGSAAANFVSSYYGVTSYPMVTYNFHHSTTSSQNSAHIKSQISSLWKANGADAGIAAASLLANTCVVVNTEVKAATENEYRITAWLLENNIYHKQTNAKAEWMNTHNHSIRQRVDSEEITGVSLGTIAAGETKSTALTLKISSDKWNRENFEVLVIVSAKNAKGKFEVVNVAKCPINDFVQYDYI